MGHNHDASSAGARSVWASSQSLELPDLVRSIFGLMLLATPRGQAVYFCSPWISDFPVFDNAFGEFESLFDKPVDQRYIRFSDFLAEIAGLADVRIVTTRSDTSRAFLANPRLSRHRGVHVRFAEESFHEKGILSPQFYLEGSMNITYMGVRVRQEKLVLHSDGTVEGRKAIGMAYLEFDRRWIQLDAST